MSKFENLRALYVEQQQKARDYWDLLANAAKGVERRLQEYLELSEPVFRVPDGSGTENYIQLGAWDGYTFTEKHYRQLDGKDGCLSFAIKITLDKAPNSYPKSGYVIPMQASAMDGNVVISLYPGTERTQEFTVANGFDDVVEGIYQALVDALSA